MPLDNTWFDQLPTVVDHPAMKGDALTPPQPSPETQPTQPGTTVDLAGNPVSVPGNVPAVNLPQIHAPQQSAPQPEDDAIDVGGAHVETPEEKARYNSSRANGEAWAQPSNTPRQSMPSPQKSDTSWFDALPTAVNHPANSPPQNGSGLLANMGAGAYDAVANNVGGLIDLPSDAINLGLRGLYGGARALNSVVGGQKPPETTPQITTNAPDLIKSAMGLIGLDPRNIIAATPSEQVARASGEGIASMLMPWSVARAIPTLVAKGLMPALSPAAEFARQALSHGSGPSQALVGAVSGASGQAAANAVPEAYKPYADMATQIIMGGVTGAADQGSRALMSPVAPYIRDAVAPFTQSGRQAAAARELSEVNTPENRALLANPPQNVPGSDQTSAQITGDPTLLAKEKAFANNPEYKPDFDARAASQNAAQKAHIEGQQTAQPASAVGDYMRAKLQQMRDAELAASQAERQTTRNAVEATGNQTTPYQVGATVRGAVNAKRAPTIAASDAAIGQADQQSATAVAGLGGDKIENALETHGARMRGAPTTPEAPGSGLLRDEQEVHDAASRLQKAVDPNGTFALDLSPLGDVARRLKQEVNPEAGGSVKPEEKDVLDAAAALHGVKLFSFLRDMRGNVAQAMREIKDKKGAAHRRMTILMEAIDETMARAAESVAEREPDLLDRLTGTEDQSTLEAGRRLPTPPKNGPDLFGATPPQAAPKTAEPTIRTDPSQTTFPGMEPSARQAQAASDAAGPRGGQKAANEGLFAKPETPQPVLPETPRVSRWAKLAGDPNFRDELSAAPKEGQQAAADWTVEQGKKDGNEHMAIVDNATGKIIQAGTSGKPREVSFPLQDTLNEPVDSLTGHHNHPNDTSISGADISTLVTPAMSHIVAHGHDGTTTIVGLAPALKRNLSTNPRVVAANAVWLRNAHHNATLVSEDILRPLLEKGEIDRETANKVYSDVANRVLEGRGVITYQSSRELPDVVQKALEAKLKALNYETNRHAITVRASEGIAGLPAPSQGRLVPGSQGSRQAGSGLSDAGKQTASDNGRGVSESNRPGNVSGRLAAGETGANSEHTIYTPKGTPIRVRYKVVDADSLVTSHDNDLRVNKEYPAEYQPRDREKSASKAQVSNIEQNLNGNLLQKSDTTLLGAPVTDKNGVVISGNGRSIGIRRAYENSLEKAAAYRKSLEDNGYDTTGIKHPVLTAQIADDLEPQDLQKIAEESNESPALSMSAAEQAVVDAKRIPDHVMAMWKPGDVDSAANADFVREFMRAVPSETGRGALQGAEGQLSAEGIRRIQGALLQRAYGDSRLTAALLENNDETVKAFGGAMLDVAGDMARLRADIAAGHVDPKMDISTELLDAARIVSEARRKGISIQSMVGQQSFLHGAPDLVVRTILRNAYGEQLNGRINRARFADDLAHYAEEAAKQTNAPRLFGENLDPTEILAKGAERGRTEATTRDTKTGASSGSSSFGQSNRPNGDQARRSGSDATGESGDKGSGGTSQGEPEINAPGSQGNLLPGAPRRGVVHFPGMPGADQAPLFGTRLGQLVSNFTEEARNRLKVANAAWADYKDRFAKGAVGDVVAPSSKVQGGYRVPDAYVPSKLWATGPAGAEAAKSLIKATGSREAAMQILGDYPAYAMRQAVEKMGAFSQKDYAKWMRDYAPILDQFPELRDSFDTAAKAKAVLDDLKAQRDIIDASHPIKPGWGDAEMMQRFVVPGDKGYEAAGALLDHVGNSPEAKSAIEDYLAHVMRNGENGSKGAEIVSGPDAGTLDKGAYDRFMKRYGSFLSHPDMADVKARFDTAAAAQDTLDRAVASHKAAQDEYLKSVAKHFLDPHADPVASMGAILNKTDPSSELKDLAGRTAGDAAAQEGVQSAVIQHIMDKITSNNPVGQDVTDRAISAAKSMKLLEKLVGDEGDGPLRHVMTPEQMESLKNVLLDLRGTSRQATTSPNAAGSHTAFVSAARQDGEHSPSVAGMFAVMEGAGELAHHITGQASRVAGMLAVPLVNWARMRGYKTINDIIASALLHPEEMSALLSKLPDESDVPSRLAAIKAQMMSLAPVSVVTSANPNDLKRNAAR